MADKFTNILAIETTDKSGSVALFSGGGLLLERKLPEVKRSAQTLAPAIDELLCELQLRSFDIGRVAVVTGPGSFTGLRVGVVTAKVFAYAVGAEIIGLSTFEVVAFGGLLSGLTGVISIGVDAQRGDVVVQDWRIDSGNCFQLSEMSMMPVDKWWQHSTEYGQEDFIFAGSALRRFGSMRPETAKVADESLFEPRAGFAAQLAKNRKQTSDVWTIKPIYARPSAADEKINKK
ncbi:MAG: tRNA (adenosine(37)-N6)-threonylcarbamoyltransferase complex dimerization subunit type 1 TsaB [Planctomycetaceae bacterium]|jgi:tRNA threonylcarbamoyladenosine biosynthesis protein TsaB|nr:tRNA (adenosine(37)-N6)-threonylcarbamoyltransferase complex dimerization subunit type 1 TsaB [Planctomycetaceae bacterium]